MWWFKISGFHVSLFSIDHSILEHWTLIVGIEHSTFSPFIHYSSFLVPCSIFRPVQRLIFRTCSRYLSITKGGKYSACSFSNQQHFQLSYFQPSLFSWYTQTTRPIVNNNQSIGVLPCAGRPNGRSRSGWPWTFGATFCFKTKGSKDRNQEEKTLKTSFQLLISTNC